jgi:hypothetical protein
MHLALSISVDLHIPEIHCERILVLELSIMCVAILSSILVLKLIIHEIEIQKLACIDNL